MISMFSKSNRAQDVYIPAQFLLISPNRIAMYWESLGHITYFERVDLDKFFVQ